MRYDVGSDLIVSFFHKYSEDPNKRPSNNRPVVSLQPDLEMVER